ncbi:hypothetical protein BC941DRAFT_408266 [Chlamydoabsidia padenii]|nr:hypothetical protein BC941DRAFT_408266 [Chlamydoabsidia padenii]
MSLIDRPNHVISHQRYFQAPSKTPLFLRGPRDKLFVYGTFLILSTGLAGSLYGATRLARDLKN